MRNEEEIRKELGEAQEAYNMAVETQPSRVVAPLSDRVKALRKELSEALSEGASPCPDCGNSPVGLRHIHVTVPTNRKVFTFEVGCVVCNDHRSQGGSVSEAVAEWNARKYLPSKG